MLPVKRASLVQHFICPLSLNSTLRIGCYRAVARPMAFAPKELIRPASLIVIAAAVETLIGYLVPLVRVIAASAPFRPLLY